MAPPARPEPGGSIVQYHAIGSCGTGGSAPPSPSVCLSTRAPSSRSLSLLVVVARRGGRLKAAALVLEGGGGAPRGTDWEGSEGRGGEFRRKLEARVPAGLEATPATPKEGARRL